MLKFKEINDQDLLLLKDYFNKTENEFCDISVGVKYMWKDNYINEYCIFNDTLILKESCPYYKNAFYFPMGKDIAGALKEIEEFCKEEKIQLQFCCIDNNHIEILKGLYKDIETNCDRDWNDYIYDAESFRTFLGKKYSGQRNHINKFKKLYPNYVFNELNPSDIERIKVFLKEFELGSDFSAWSAKEEEKKVFDLTEKSFYFGNIGGYIDVEGKIVAFSIGERIKDTLIIHIEKGLKDYQGVYPTMANEFARHFATDGITFINREEDCGDLGLRTSKMQYHPIEIKEKNTVKIKNIGESFFIPSEIKTKRLTLTQIKEQDKQDYFRLYLDKEVNKYYGYDYTADLNGQEPTEDYFFNFQERLKKDEKEYSFAVRKDDKLIGEVVIYNFGYRQEAEIGFRFFMEYQGFGYAKESAEAVINYAKAFGIKKINCRAYKENIKSIALIERLGLKFIEERNGQLFFSLEI